MKRFTGATVPKGHGGARCNGQKGSPMKYARWQRVEKDASVKPFLVVNAFSSRFHHDTKQATTTTTTPTTPPTTTPPPPESLPLRRVLHLPGI